MHDSHQRIFSKNKSKISYPVCKSAIKPVPHSSDLPVPQPPTEKEDSLSVMACESTSTESEEEPVELDPSFQHESAPLFINQERLNDLVRDLYLSKEKAEILGSRLQLFHRFVVAIRILQVIMQVLKTYAIVKILVA